MTIPRNLSFLAQGASSTGVLSVPYGGTGLTTLTAGYIPYGNGTGAFSNTSLFTYATNRLTATNSIFANGGMTLGRDSSSGGVYNTLDFVEGVTTTGYLRNYGSVYGSGLNYATELWNSQNGIIRFGTNNTERMRIDSSGNVGIGTANPANSLNIVADNTPYRGQLSLQTVSASNFAQISFYDRTTLSAQIYQEYGGSVLNILTSVSSPIAFGTNGTERMRLFSSGGLSLGNTTDPGATNLSVTGAITSASLATTAGLRTGGYLATGSFGYYINQGISGSVAYIQSFNNTTLNTLSLDCNDFQIRVAGFATGLQLDTTGNLSVAGTTKTAGYTVATLPTGVTGARTYVTNALAPTFGAAVVGGGAVTIPVFYNGTNWIVA